MEKSTAINLGLGFAAGVACSVGYSIVTARKKKPFFVSPRSIPNSTPVLLLTDIGADIDDTFALLALSGAPHCHIVGVVTAVNDGLERASIVRGWLRKLGVPDAQVPIMPTMDVATASCVRPEGFPSPADSDLVALEDTPRAIVAIAEAYGSDLVIMAIAPVTPLAEALRVDTNGALKRVGRLYLQGNVVVTDEGTLKPDPQAYNFRIHMGAAERVFAELQGTVPFTLLGKFAAYAVGVTKPDLEALDDAVSGMPPLVAMAKAQMSSFRTQNYELWSRLYPVPERFNRREDPDSWFVHLPGGVISHPYDPLVVLLCARDASEAHGAAEPLGGAKWPLQAVTLGHVCKGRGAHVAIGNTREANGVVDAETCKDILTSLMLRGMLRGAKGGQSY